MVSPPPVDQLLIGGALFLFPGFTWSWALLPGMSWTHRIPIAILAAFTVEPAFMFFLHLFLQVPISREVTVFLLAATGLAGVGLALARHASHWSLDVDRKPS